MWQVMGQRASLLLRRVSFAARSVIRHGCRSGPFYAQEYRGGTHEFVALQRPSPPRGRLPKHTPDRLYAASASASAGQASRRHKPIFKKRCRLLPSPVFQGSRSGGGLGGGAAVWIQSSELLFDGQPGKRRGRAGSARRV